MLLWSQLFPDHYPSDEQQETLGLTNAHEAVERMTRRNFFITAVIGLVLFGYVALFPPSVWITVAILIVNTLLVASSLYNGLDVVMSYADLEAAARRGIIVPGVMYIAVIINGVYIFTSICTLLS